MTDINREAVRVYESWKKRVNYLDGERMRGIRAVLRLLMDGRDPEELIQAGLNYKQEMEKVNRIEKHTQWCCTFYSMVGKSPTGEPEWAMYMPGTYELYSEPVESPVRPPEEKQVSSPKMTFGTFMRHAGRAAEEVRDGDE